MNEKTNRLIRVTYAVLFSVYTVLVGVLFILKCISIYTSADSSPYTVESISLHFDEIRPFIWYWVALFVGTFIIELFFPKTEKQKVSVPQDKVLEGAKARLPETEATSEIWKKSKTLTTVRRWVWYATLAIFSAMMIVCATLLFVNITIPADTQNFYVIHDALVLRLIKGLPFMISAIVVCVGVSIFEHYSVKGEIKAFKEATAAYVKQGGKLNKLSQKTLAEEQPVKKMNALNITRIVFAAVGVALVIFGIFNGGVGEVFLKAINICTQCIGLG